jgi:hypothetical protein
MKTRIFVVLASLLLTAGMCFGQSAPKDSGQNPGFPRVVARLNLLNRTKAIGPETLYTPTKSGVFRVSGTIVCTKAGNYGFWFESITYTNEIGVNAGFVEPAGVRSDIVESGPGTSATTFNAFAGVPIQFAIVTEFDTSGSEYNAYVVLEQLE